MGRGYHTWGVRFYLLDLLNSDLIVVSGTWLSYLGSWLYLLYLLNSDLIVVRGTWLSYLRSSVIPAVPAEQ